MRFHNSLAGVVIDRFGRDVMLIPDGEEHFVFTAEIAVSPIYFGWLSGFGDRARILYPQSVIENTGSSALRRWSSTNKNPRRPFRLPRVFYACKTAS